MAASDKERKSQFIGIVNPLDQDISGKLAHTAVEGPFAPGTTFEVAVFANRGRLELANTPVFDTRPSEILVTLFGWGPGSDPTIVPTINPNTDNWSRSPSVKLLQAFTNWAANGVWASQTFEFVTNNDLQFIALSIAGVNHKRACYVAFDIE